MMQNDPDTASKNIMRHSSGVERTALTGVGITDSSPTYWLRILDVHDRDLRRYINCPRYFRKQRSP